MQVTVLNPEVLDLRRLRRGAARCRSEDPAGARHLRAQRHEAGQAVPRTRRRSRRGEAGQQAIAAPLEGRSRGRAVPDREQGRSVDPPETGIAIAGRGEAAQQAEAHDLGQLCDKSGHARREAPDWPDARRQGRSKARADLEAGEGGGCSCRRACAQADREGEEVALELCIRIR